MSIIGICPRSFCKMLIHLWPCFGIGAESPGQSLPTYSSMADNVHRLQLVHSATSMIMFHFFIVICSDCVSLSPLAGRGWGEGASPLGSELRRSDSLRRPSPSV